MKLIFTLKKQHQALTPFHFKANLHFYFDAFRFSPLLLHFLLTLGFLMYLSLFLFLLMATIYSTPSMLLALSKQILHLWLCTYFLSSLSSHSSNEQDKNRDLFIFLFFICSRFRKILFAEHESFLQQLNFFIFPKKKLQSEFNFFLFHFRKFLLQWILEALSFFSRSALAVKQR